MTIRRALVVASLASLGLYAGCKQDKPAQPAPSAQAKAPGETMAGEPVELVARHQSAENSLPYERLLGDALSGEAMLFTRADAVEAAWAVVEPVLGQAAPPALYEPGTWGPPEAERVIAPDDGWHNPAEAPMPAKSASP